MQMSFYSFFFILVHIEYYLKTVSTLSNKKNPNFILFRMDNCNCAVYIMSCIMAKMLLVKHRVTSGGSAGNHVEKKIKSSHALTGTGPQTATGTLHRSPCTLTILRHVPLSVSICVGLCVYQIYKLYI